MPISLAADVRAVRKSGLASQRNRDRRSKNAVIPELRVCLNVRIGFEAGSGSGGQGSLPRLSHLQLYASTEGQPRQRSSRCFHQMLGMAWQSTRAGRSPLPEAARSTWREIKHAWCPATTVNMPRQERQRGRSPTELPLGCGRGSGCERKKVAEECSPYGASCSTFHYCNCFIICKFFDLVLKQSSVLKQALHFPVQMCMFSHI